MFFSKTAEYAIRILTFISKDYEKKETFTVKALHEELSLPLKYTSKLMTMLAKKKLVARTRGRTGGYKLIKNPGSINLQDILKAVDNIENYNKCILGFKECSNKVPCVMHEYWETQKKELNRMISEISLFDLKSAKSVKD